MARRKERTPLRPQGEGSAAQTPPVSDQDVENAGAVSPASTQEPQGLSEEEAARAVEALAALAGEPESTAESLPEEVPAVAAKEEAEEKLSLEVQIEELSPCERHIVVTIPREEIERYFQREFDELAETAAVPGFRPGRAPRKLIERRFRKSVADSVRYTLVVDAIEQVTKDHKLTPIGEPEINIDAVLLPEEGPLTFEYKLEVRPTFELPEWRGMQLEAWKVEVTDAEIDREIRRLLEAEGSLEAYDGPAELGDYVVVDLKFTQADRLIAESSGEVIRVKKVLTFWDAEIPNFDRLMVGVRAGDVRQCLVHVSPQSPDITLRDTDVLATFTVREVKRVRVPEISPELLAKWEVESVEELREKIAHSLLSRKQFASNRHLRHQITAKLLEGADFAVPPSVLMNQGRRELRRIIYEMQTYGLTEEQINRVLPSITRDLVNQIVVAIREHFILERIAEELGLTVPDSEVYEAIRQLALQRGISPRRLRAQLERDPGLDIIVNTILEQKVLDAIVENASIVEVPMPEEVDEVYPLRRSIGTLPEGLTSELAEEEM